MVACCCIPKIDSWIFIFFSLPLEFFVVVHEHEQHDVVIVMFSGRPSLIYSLAGLSRAAWDTEEDQTLIEIFRLMNICWIVKIVLINLCAIIICLHHTGARATCTAKLSLLP